MLAAKLYESQGNEFVLLSEPRLATGNHQQAEFRLTSENGGSFRVVITPAIQ
jgi:hypothetical protein